MWFCIFNGLISNRYSGIPIFEPLKEMEIGPKNWDFEKKQIRK